ncbi:hypothetical protein HZS_7617 [Henneguya salminicola]|nr:hypothetical protein HZS_7617 [Henneguya salminicola]
MEKRIALTIRMKGYNANVRLVKNNYIKSINIKNMANGHLALIWASKENIEQNYNVSFIARHINVIL